jgi:hypothetical protein
MSTELQMEILGIVGTLLGTILGWLLNGLSQKGKLSVFIKKWNESLQKLDGYGGFDECRNYDEAEYYHYSLSVDIYNSSRDTRILRDIKLIFKDGIKDCFVSIPKDEATRKNAFPAVYYDDISILNLPAKSAINIELHGGLNHKNDNWKYLSQTKNVLLEYVDEKNRKKRIEICKSRGIV